jgi:hypothetical protein
MIRKTCNKCNLEKNLDKFYPKPGGLYGVEGICKVCSKKRTTKWYKRLSFSSKRNRQLKAVHGLSLQDYNHLYDIQNGVCAICGKSETRKTKNTICPLSIDHDHKTGKVRGLLCSLCNTGFGSFHESVDIIEKAKQYAIKFNKGISYEVI